MQTQHDSTYFELDSRLKKVEAFQLDLDELYRRSNEHKLALDETLESLKTQNVAFITEVRQSVDKVNQRAIQDTENMNNLINRVDTMQEKYDTMSENMFNVETLLYGMKTKIQKLESEKLERLEFIEVADKTRKNHHDLQRRVEKMLADV